MKNLIIINIILFVYWGLSLTSNEFTSTQLYRNFPYNISACNNNTNDNDIKYYISILKTRLSNLTLKEYIKIQNIRNCSDTIVREFDSVRLVIKSGISWDLLRDPPNWISFDKKKRKDGFKYQKFRDEWISRGELPYERIKKILVYERVYSNNDIICFQLMYEIKPDSIGNLKIINKKIIDKLK